MKFFPRSALSLGLLLCVSTASAQQPPPPPPAESSQPSSEKSKAKPVPSFLIIGTVFNEKALSFPGVPVRIRRQGEKKFAWETYTNSRGEFAVRVPPGVHYEVVVHMKKYKERTAKVDSTADVQQRLSIQLEPTDQSAEASTGAKS